MRALVTGGAGFIGSHLVDALLERGCRVTAIDDLSTGKIDNIRRHLDNPNFLFARASILDEPVLDRLAAQSNVIFHLAAAVGVDLIVKHPVRTIETNVRGSEAVLKAALRYQCRVLLASTSEVYGKGAKSPFSEEDDVLLGATSKSRWAYAISKMLDESLGFAYDQEHDLRVDIMRLFNTVGPRQTGRYGMVIPRFMRQALHGEPITVYGDGNQTRCFCDVLDVIRAMVGLVESKTESAKVYNIGGNREISIQELAVLIKEIAGSSSEIIKVPYSEAYAPGFEDMMRRLPDTSRIRSHLGWQPEISLEQTLERVKDYILSKNS